jgi:hypothetical protein
VGPEKNTVLMGKMVVAVVADHLTAHRAAERSGRVLLAVMGLLYRAVEVGALVESGETGLS